MLGRQDMFTEVSFAHCKRILAHLGSWQSKNRKFLQCESDISTFQKRLQDHKSEVTNYRGKIRIICKISGKYWMKRYKEEHQL